VSSVPLWPSLLCALGASVAKSTPSRSPFAARVLRLLRRVPPGRVITYGDLAALAGRPGAARAVGNIMRNAGAPGLPYHRVIAAGGRVGGYGGNEGLKQALLRQEGIVVIGGRVRSFQSRRWFPPAQVNLRRRRT
jgi:methylated-DNA-[protein]-cysteine S-methyltransferase